MSDLTLDEVVAAMRKRRIAGSRSAVWRCARKTEPLCTAGAVRIRLGDGVADSFPSKEQAGFSQRPSLRMPKDNEVFRLERDNELVAVASVATLRLSGRLMTPVPADFRPNARPAAFLPHQLGEHGSDELRIALSRRL